MSDKCKKCGACKECGAQAPPPHVVYVYYPNPYRADHVPAVTWRSNTAIPSATYWTTNG